MSINPCSGFIVHFHSSRYTVPYSLNLVYTSFQYSMILVPPPFHNVNRYSEMPIAIGYCYMRMPYSHQ
jgi:hypothetical protein